MRILITNDDGVNASQLVPLIQWAQKLGEVVTAVPKFEQSGKSHGIEIHKSFEVKKVTLAPGIEVYAVDSTPADCVRFAVLGLEQQFDLVISGINRGLNIGSDIMYSGTVAAIFEAAALGIKGIALSTAPSSYEQAISHMDTIYDYFIRHALLEKNGLYNVNIPTEIKGTRITRQGGPYYSDDFAPQGNDMFLPKGKCVYEEGSDYEVDTHAVLHGYISITPLTIERTDLLTFETLKELNS